MKDSNDFQMIIRQSNSLAITAIPPNQPDHSGEESKCCNRKISFII